MFVERIVYSVHTMVSYLASYFHILYDVNEAAHVNLVKAKVVKLLMKNKKRANKCEDDIADQMVIVTVQKVLSRWLLVWH